MAISRIKSDAGIEVMIYNSSAGGKAPIHGAYFADAEGFKWIPWSWNAKGESFPLRIHNLDITLSVAAGEHETIQINNEEGKTQEVVAGS